MWVAQAKALKGCLRETFGKEGKVCIHLMSAVCDTTMYANLPIKVCMNAWVKFHLL